MADSPDVVARAMGGAALVVSGLALWLNWQKNERDLAALRPQVSISIEKVNTRRWRIRLTVVNPLLVPIEWRTVHAIGPQGLELADGERADQVAASPNDIHVDYTPWLYVRGYPIKIDPKGSHVWYGYARIDDRYGVARDAMPSVRPGIDGFDKSSTGLRAWLSRRLRWVWPSVHA